MQSEEYFLQNEDEWDAPNASLSQRLKYKLEKPYICKTEVGRKILESVTNENPEDGGYLQKIIPFKDKPTRTAECNLIFSGLCRIYKCYDCQKHQNACICETCFKAGNHTGHRFFMYESNSNMAGMCDCGNEEIWDKEGFCGKHTGRIEYVDIPPQEKEAFFSIFTDAFGIYFDLLSEEDQKLGHKYKNNLLSLLMALTNGSMYYKQLTAELMIQPDPLFKDKSIFQSIMSIHVTQFNELDFNLLISIFNLDRYTLDMTRSIIKCYNSVPFILKVRFFAEFFFQTINKIDIYDQLAKSQDLILYPKIINNKYIHHFQTIMNFEEPPLEVLKCFIRKQIIRDNYPQIESIVLKILIELKSDRHYLGQGIKQLIQCKENTSSKIAFSLVLFNNGVDRKLDYRALFKEMDVEDSLWREFLLKYFLEEYAQYFLKPINKAFLVPILFVKFSLGFDFIQKIVDQFFQNVENSQQQSLEIRSILWLTMVDLVWIKEKKEVEFSSMLELNSPTVIVESKKVMKQIFSSMETFEKECLQGIVQQFAKGFKSNLKEFIRQNLKYNPRTEQYTYIGEKITPNRDSMNEQKISDRIRFSQEDYKLLEIMLPPKRIKQLVDFQHEINKLYQQKGTGQLVQKLIDQWVRTLLQLNCLYGEEKPEILQTLQMLQTGEINLLQLLSDGQLKRDISSYLEINTKSSSEKTMNFKEKAAEMKKKKFEQLRKKQEKAKMLTNNSMSECIEEMVPEFICLLCHDSKSQNQLVSFISISKNTALSSAMGSQTQEIDIRGCIHRVHENCFIKSYGEMKYFLCPLCKSINNCVLPGSLSQQSKVKDSSWAIRIETILALSFSKSQYTVFQIFFSYLVFSKGIKVLLQTNDLHDKERRRIDQISTIIIKRIFEEAEESEKAKYLNRIAQLRAEFQKDKSQGQIKLIMKTFALDLILFELGGVPKAIGKELSVLKEVHQQIGMENVIKIMKQLSPNVSDHSDAIQLKAEIEEICTHNELTRKNLFTMQLPPETAKEYFAAFSMQCPVCSKIELNIWQCLLCNKSVCNNCESVNVHITRLHGGESIIVQKTNATYMLFYNGSFIKEDGLYQNELNENWRREKKQEGFVSNFKQVVGYHECLLNGDIPSIINREGLVNRFNGNMFIDNVFMNFLQEELEEDLG